MRMLPGSSTIFTRLAIGLLVLSARGIVQRINHMDEGMWDARFVCGYPDYPRLHAGMSKAAIERILGVPKRRRLNARARVLDPATIAHLRTQRGRITNEEFKIYDRIDKTYPRPSGLTEYRLRQRLGRCEKQIERLDAALAVLIQEVWYYEPLGWHGTIEVSIDVFGRLCGANCGYG